MIRKLKPGEIIKDMDFYTVNDEMDGERRPVLSRIGLNFCGDTPIFREIPDKLAINHNTGAKYILFSSSYLLVEKESLKAYAEWLLEIAEVME
jgi:hypothetical protein